MSRKITILSLAMLLCVCHMATAEVHIAEVFGSGMVLQREVPVPVWGTAGPGEGVTVAFATQAKTTRADKEGKWKVLLDPLAATHTGRTFSFGSTAEGATAIELSDVVVGDVWLLISGYEKLGHRQNRAGYTGPLGHYVDLQPYIDQDAELETFPCIRAFRSHTPRRAARQAYPRREYGKGRDWQLYNTTHWRGFSGVAYFAGRICWRDEQTPMGFLRLNPDELATLTPIEGFQAVPEFKSVADRLLTWDVETSTGRAGHRKALAEARLWSEALKTRLAGDQPLDPTQPPPMPGPTPGQSEPSTAYNAMIVPVIPFAVRGIILRPFSLNFNDSDYAVKMRALIAGLRAVLGSKEMPVCLLQTTLPMYFDLEQPGKAEGWDVLRARQAEVATLPGVSVLPTYDFRHDPRDPHNFGRRIARWMLAVRKGSKTLCGPTFKTHKIKGTRVTVQFDNVGAGLMVATRQQAAGAVAVAAPDAPLGGFAIAGADGTWHAAAAAIDGNRVIVSATNGVAPVAVRYAHENEPRNANLYNCEGFPALPFVAGTVKSLLKE